MTSACQVVSKLFINILALHPLTIPAYEINPLKSLNIRVRLRLIKICVNLCHSVSICGSRIVTLLLTSSIMTEAMPALIRSSPMNGQNPIFNTR